MPWYGVIHSLPRSKLIASRAYVLSPYSWIALFIFVALCVICMPLNTARDLARHANKLVIIFAIHVKICDNFRHYK